MTSGDYLRQLLRPLGVYRLEGTINGGALESAGMALDGAGGSLAEIQREMLLTTAEHWGLDRVEQLLNLRPVTQDPARRKAALAALLRIGGDSFTLRAINDNLKGCGLNAVASETSTANTVEVRFPEVPGIPEGIAAMKEIIEAILPCHLDIHYVYWYITWAKIEAQFPTWGALERAGLTWGQLEKFVK